MDSNINNQPSTAFPHEKLEVWRLAKALAGRVYLLMSSFPKDEQFGLVDQMRRASVSVMSNLAEGCGRTSARDQIHFRNWLDVRHSVVELVKKISALRASQLKRVSE